MMDRAQQRPSRAIRTTMGGGDAKGDLASTLSPILCFIRLHSCGSAQLRFHQSFAMRSWAYIETMPCAVHTSGAGGWKPVSLENQPGGNCRLLASNDVERFGVLRSMSS